VTRNVLGALPKSVHASARRALNEIILAEDLDHARAAIEAFATDYGTKRPKAVAKVTDDAEALLSGCTCAPPTPSRVPSRRSGPAPG
jgi:transposase-like protein